MKHHKEVATTHYLVLTGDELMVLNRLLSNYVEQFGSKLPGGVADLDEDERRLIGNLYYAKTGNVLHNDYLNFPPELEDD